jgi:hypothetical protein
VGSLECNLRHPKLCPLFSLEHRCDVVRDHERPAVPARVHRDATHRRASGGGVPAFHPLAYSHGLVEFKLTPEMDIAGFDAAAPRAIEAMLTL